MNDEILCLGGFGLIFFLIGLLAAWRAMTDWRQYRESADWLPVTAQITASHVTTQRGNKGTTYGIHIAYTYQVMGQSYQGNRVAFGEEGSSYAYRTAEKIVARYAPGDQTVVYYDPNAPSEAVLERKYDSTSAILAVIFGLIGVGMIILGLQ